MDQILSFYNWLLFRREVKRFLTKLSPAEVIDSPYEWRCWVDSNVYRIVCFRGKINNKKTKQKQNKKKKKKKRVWSTGSFDVCNIVLEILLTTTALYFTKQFIQLFFNDAKLY